MQFLFYIAIHKRLPIVRKCLENLSNLQKKFNMNVFCVCSANDEAAMCAEFGFDWTIEDNFPLGRKMNKGIRQAMDFEFTHLIQLGSDDIITEALMDKYVKLAHEDYFGINSFIAVDLETKRAKYWLYGTKAAPINHPIGAGRVFSRKALEDVLSKTDLWEDDRQKVLDGQSDITMIKYGYRATIVPIDFIGIVDMKTSDNIWPFDNTIGEPFDYESVKEFVE